MQAGAVLLRGVLARPGGLAGQRVDRAGGGQDRLVHRGLRVGAARQRLAERVGRRAGGGRGRLVGAGRGGDPVADHGHRDRRAVREGGGRQGERVLVAVVAQAAVADRGDGPRLLFHVVPFPRLGVAAVLAVTVTVHPAGPARHTGLAVGAPRRGGSRHGGPRVRRARGGRLEDVAVRRGLRPAVRGGPRPGASGRGGRRRRVVASPQGDRRRVGLRHRGRRKVQATGPAVEIGRLDRLGAARAGGQAVGVGSHRRHHYTHVRGR
ncbi:hypothetical protein M2169_003901 [Streptomyces sp. MJP52]|nr:hypothetical protein [Streptomyces sp. MJP52]